MIKHPDALYSATTPILPHVGERIRQTVCLIQASAHPFHPLWPLSRGFVKLHLYACMYVSLYKCNKLYIAR